MTAVPPSDQRITELRDSGAAVGKLAEDPRRFERLVAAFRAEDADAFQPSWSRPVSRITAGCFAAGYAKPAG